MKLFQKSFIWVFGYFWADTRVHSDQRLDSQISYAYWQGKQMHLSAIYWRVTLETFQHKFFVWSYNAGWRLEKLGTRLPNKMLFHILQAVKNIMHHWTFPSCDMFHLEQDQLPSPGLRISRVFSDKFPNDSHVMWIAVLLFWTRMVPNPGGSWELVTEVDLQTHVTIAPIF